MPNNNALHSAAKIGNLAEVQSQVSNFDINAKGEKDGTALYWSAREGSADVVKFLLTFNPDVNIPDVRRTLKMISVHLICISPIPRIYFIYISCYTSRHVLLSLVVDVPPHTTHDIQYLFFSSFCCLPF